MVATELENLPTERLEAEICASAAHLAAAECRLLLLIGEFDRRDGAGGWGLASTAHWLNWMCALTLGAAPGARAGGAPPGRAGPGAGGLRPGELSYTEVRALTRVAGPANGPELVYLAGQMTAEHLERLCRA
jgi:hypothetical protein